MNKICYLLVIVLCLSVIGCFKSKSYDSIYGTYEGHYAGGIETLIIREGGSYEQSFVVGGKMVYNSSGRYRYNGGERISFSDFIYLLDVSSFDYVEPSKARRLESLGVYFSKGFEFLFLNEDAKYGLKRTESAK